MEQELYEDEGQEELGGKYSIWFACQDQYLLYWSADDLKCAYGCLDVAGSEGAAVILVDTKKKRGCECPRKWMTYDDMILLLESWERNWAFWDRVNQEEEQWIT